MYFKDWHHSRLWLTQLLCLATGIGGAPSVLHAKSRRLVTATLGAGANSFVTIFDLDTFKVLTNMALPPGTKVLAMVGGGPQPPLCLPTIQCNVLSSSCTCTCMHTHIRQALDDATQRIYGLLLTNKGTMLTTSVVTIDPLSGVASTMTVWPNNGLVFSVGSIATIVSTTYLFVPVHGV